MNRIVLFLIFCFAFGVASYGSNKRLPLDTAKWDPLLKNIDKTSISYDDILSQTRTIDLSLKLRLYDHYKNNLTASLALDAIPVGGAESFIFGDLQTGFISLGIYTVGLSFLGFSIAYADTFPTIASTTVLVGILMVVASKVFDIFKTVEHTDTRNFKLKEVLDLNNGIQAYIEPEFTLISPQAFNIGVCSTFKF